MSKGTQITITGRFVQGGLKLQPKTDEKGNKVMRKDDPTKQVEECFLAVAVAKTDPAFPTYWAAYNAVAKAAFPHLFDAAGNCTHPRFAWKLQDGDGVDKNGKSVKDKPGFAGHWIFKMVTQYAPRCYIKDSHGNLTQLEDPEKLIKRGYRIAVAVALDGNGVGADAGSAVPGLYASPNLVLFVAPDEEIVSGPDPNEAFAGVTTAAVPAGAAAPGIGLPGLPAGPALPPPAAAGPALPAPVAAGPALPPPAAAGPALPGATILPPPAAPAGPVYQMQPSAQGATREALLANGWSDEALIAAGHMIRVG